MRARPLLRDPYVSPRPSDNETITKFVSVSLDGGWNGLDYPQKKKVWLGEGYYAYPRQSQSRIHRLSSSRRKKKGAPVEDEEAS